MELLHSGVDRAVIELWLGHELSVKTTYVYLHADLKLKEQAMARATPAHVPPQPRHARIPEHPVIIPQTRTQRARSPPTPDVNPGIRRIRE